MTVVKSIKKRDNSIVKFDLEKVVKAISKAGNETGEFDYNVAEDLANEVLNELSQSINDELTVELVQDTVEMVLLNSEYKLTAKVYIIYREKRTQERKPDIFKTRINLKPYEYPQLNQFKEAVQHSYWLHTEFNYTSDIHDYKVNINDVERNAIKNAMLAISQVEVAVKNFWGDLHNRMNKPEIGAVGATFSESECYKEGTEILTPNGWIDFRDINNGDLVAQYNHDGTVEFVPCRNKIVKDVNGKLHHLTKSYMDAWVTPNHNMVIYKKKDNEKFDLVPSVDSGKNSNWFMPQTAKLNGDVDSLSDKERLYIALQADGNFRFWTDKDGVRRPRGEKSNTQTYEISFKKERKISRFNDIVSKVEDCKVTEYNVSREGYKKYSVDIDKNNNYKEFDWVDLSDKSWKWCKEFIAELVEWDGCKIKGKKDGNMSFSTTNKNVADKVQAIATLAGYRVTITEYEDKRSDNFKNVYKMVFVENRERVTAVYNKEEVDYIGKVYCVEVDSGAIITKYGGKTLIAGNCRHSDAYSHLLELLGLNDEFEKIQTIPALANRVESLQQALKYMKTENNRDFTISLILFSLFIEHVSLFSQFLVIMAFNKHKNIFKGISNAIEATSKEEQLHGLFGIELVNIIREENPQWFDEDMTKKVYEACETTFKSELDVIDWIYEAGDLDFLPKDVVKEFIKNRLNNSLKSTGFEPLFEINEDLVEQTDWFDDEILATKHVDFFVKRSVNYTKKSQSFDADDLF